MYNINNNSNQMIFNNRYFCIEKEENKIRKKLTRNRRDALRCSLNRKRDIIN